MNSKDASELLKAVKALHAFLEKSDVHANPHQGTSDQQPEHAIEKPPATLKGAAIPETPKQSQKTGKKDGVSTTDWWERIKGALEVIGICLAVYIALLTRGTLEQATVQAKAAQDQVAIMRSQLEATDRPWITVESMDLQEGATFRANTFGREMGFIFAAHLKNIGRSVAANVVIRSRVMTFQPIIEAPLQMQKGMCDQARIESGADVKATIFPDKMYIQAFGANLPEKDILNNKVRGPRLNNGFLPGDYFLPYLIGCVDYNFTGSAESHQTGFLYQINSKMVAVKYGVSTPAADLVLRPYPFGGDYAH